MNPYERTRTRGVLLNCRTLEMLERVEARLGHRLTLTQGSYSTTASASAGTHAGGGALDARALGLSNSARRRTVAELRHVGFAAWLRTPAQGDWPLHIHAIAIGDRELSPAAARQVQAYKAGRNGLASNGPDDGPRVAWTEYPQTLQEDDVSAAETWSHKIKHAGQSETEAPAAVHLTYGRRAAQTAADLAAQCLARLGALEAGQAQILALLAGDASTLTPEQIQAASYAGARQAIAEGVNVHISVDDEDNPPQP